LLLEFVPWPLVRLYREVPAGSQGKKYVSHQADDYDSEQGSPGRKCKNFLGKKGVVIYQNLKRLRVMEWRLHERGLDDARLNFIKYNRRTSQLASKKSLKTKKKKNRFGGENSPSRSERSRPAEKQRKSGSTGPS